MTIDSAKPVVIAGGGLVGSLLALFLRRRDLPVTVIEARPDLRRADAVGGRSINLVLTRRGLRALDRVGLAGQALELTRAVTGRMIHDPEGECVFQPYGREDSECNYSVSRTGLNAFLIQKAEEAGARFHFETSVVDADLDAGRLEVREAAGERRALAAGVVFAAEGAGSVIRERVMTRRPGFATGSEMLDYGYKELTIPAAPGGDYRIEPHALHIWPRSAFMLMALPDLEGSFTVTLYLPHRGPVSFETVERDGAEAFFRDHFPDAVPLLPSLAEDYAANPVGELGTVRCRPWDAGGKGVLIGDAAHAIVPFFGQGMNTGFEDCTVLDGLLDEHGTDAWETVFPRFGEVRKPDADAIATMALENFVEMRDHVGDAGFLLRKQVEHRLEQVMPKRYRSRYSMVMYSHIPFHLAFEAGEIQRGLLDELCDGLDDAEELDLERAGRRIDAGLTPFLERHGLALDY